MQQIADWLKKLGMSEYAQCFAENGIDVSVLRYLTDQDLEKIGVLLGHRRKMLAAIAQSDDTSAAPTSVPAPQSRPRAMSTVPPAPEATGERRHVTVMFCDLVDSTGIAARLDAEEWRARLKSRQRSCNGRETRSRRPAAAVGAVAKSNKLRSRCAITEGIAGPARVTL